MEGQIMPCKKKYHALISHDCDFKNHNYEISQHYDILSQSYDFKKSKLTY